MIHEPIKVFVNLIAIPADFCSGVENYHLKPMFAHVMETKEG